MPSADIVASVTITESPVLGSFKAPKGFPRKQENPQDAPAKTFKRRQDNLQETKRKNRNTFITSDGIRSWIPDPNQNQALPAAIRPLTPPINFRDNFKSWIDDGFLRNQTLGRKSDSAGTTPLVQQSPPTPETTPPRKIRRSPSLEAFPAASVSSDRLTEASRHNTEERTDSFKTARENVSSDEESNPEVSPSLRASRQKWLRDSGLAKNPGIGLGLGLEFDGEEPPTPKETIIQNPSASREDFVTFNGVWGSDSPSGVDDAESQTTALRDTEEKTSNKAEKTRDKVEETSSVLKDLQSQKKSDTIEESEVKARRDVRDTEEGIDASDNRLSQASTNSTVVEAMVIDPPPVRRRTLRHTGKIVGPDSVRLSRTLSKGNDNPIKHRLRSVRSPSRGLRKSFVIEDTSTEFSSSREKRLAVTVIPDRRASLQSSVNDKKHLTKTFSTSSHQQSSRPTTAPEDSVSYSDIPRRDQRSVSVFIQQAVPIKTDMRPEKVLSSPITTDTSPTAAGPSQTMSRTTSVASGGLRTHYIPGTPSQEFGIPQPNEAQDNLVMGVRKSSSGDWAVTRPRSAMVTPFSLRSAHSSTPGTLEVSEATAINIYPHTNESILVIQEMAGRDDSIPREQSAVIAGNASSVLPGPVAPTVYRERSLSPPTRALVDSPLQNPRDPPQPPDFKVIPPTPANAASSSDDTVPKSRSSSRAKRLSAPITSLKRAMSARRYSETIVNPLTRTFSLKSSGLRQRPRTLTDEDSKLHPLWRPRTFWENHEDNDSDSEFGNEGVLSPRRSDSYSVPRRSMSLTRRFTGSLRGAPVPRPRRTSFTSSNQTPYSSAHAYADSGAPPKRTQSLTRKLGGSLRLPSRRSRYASTAEWKGQPHYEFVRPEGQEDHHVPGQGHQVHLIGFRGLAERLERRRETKEEGKREERRNWLRGRIGLVGPRDLTGFDMVHPVRPVADD